MSLSSAADLDCCNRVEFVSPRSCREAGSLSTGKGLVSLLLNMYYQTRCLMPAWTLTKPTMQVEVWTLGYEERCVIITVAKAEAQVKSMSESVSRLPDSIREASKRLGGLSFQSTTANRRSIRVAVHGCWNYLFLWRVASNLHRLVCLNYPSGPLETDSRLTV